jgi:hypothetical protein
VWLGQAHFKGVVESLVVWLGNLRGVKVTSSIGRVRKILGIFWEIFLEAFERGKVPLGER